MNMPMRSEAYMQEIIWDKIVRLKTLWKKYQPKELKPGVLETKEDPYA